MWLKLPDGSTFNTESARTLKYGVAGGDGEWGVLAVMPSGDEVTLAQFTSPQAAQVAYDTITDRLKHGTRFLEL